MKKILVVGGNSGIGLAIVSNLLKRNVEKIYVVGKDAPNIYDLEENIRDIYEEKVIFKKSNFVNFDINVFNEIIDIDSLIITAGFGRVAHFEDLTEPEIKNLIRVNLEANTLILKHFYSKIADHKDFFTSIMVSICGHIVSPLFSVYGATKSGLKFLIENLNCELMSNGYTNRILDVSPGSLKGTNFNGEKNNLKLLENVADEIINRMLKKETLYIPQYVDVYKDVLNRYNNNKEKFGIESYQYKINNNRLNSHPQVKIGYLSGTFDLFHIGHLNLLKRAKEQCDYLIVSVHNSGAWKGKETFIPYDERCAIVSSIKYVDKVVEDFKEDSDAWDKYRYDVLFVGSDYKGTERFNRYEEILKGKAEIVYFPYTQGTSSTQLRNSISNSTKK